MGIDLELKEHEPVFVPVRLTDDDARACISRDDRVLHVADLIARGEWDGRPTAKRLALIWCVSVGAVNNYHQSAALLCKADRGDLQAQRENAIGAWAVLREIALKSGDVKAAVAAQTGQDKAAGVVERGPQVQIITQNPAVVALIRTILTTLERFPEAREAVVDAVRSEVGSRRALSALPARNEPH